MQTAPLAPRRTLEFGIYRDGDNNLDALQEAAVSQALALSRRDPAIAFAIEDTGTLITDRTTTDAFDLADGVKRGETITNAKEMSDPKTLAAFVAHTLDQAEASGAAQTWIDLVDHGGGDGGGLQTSDGHVMPMPQIANAISEGLAIHAHAHPEDASRRVDGVVANQCLMATLGFTDALSRVGVRYLAASPETMVAPGVPTGVAEAVAANERDPRAMARAIVADVMETRYGAGPFGAFGHFAPAAAFDVIDCSPSRVGDAERTIARLNARLAADAEDPSVRTEIRRDIASVHGMARIPQGDVLPWRADRPAIAVYERLANDAHLDSITRTYARAAEHAVRGLVLAHAESAHFAPFGGASYRDAAGPTVHLPLSAKEIDPWAPRVRETNNAFYRAVDAPSLTRAIA